MLPTVIYFDGDSVPSLMRFFITSIIKELEKIGYNTYRVDLNFKDNHNESLHEYAKNNKCIVFTSNGVGIFQNRHFIHPSYLRGTTPFWDLFNIPVYDYLLDHVLWLPYSLYSKEIPKNYIMCCVDQNHMKYLLRRKKKAFFLPLGGSLADYDIPFEHRKNELVFCANSKIQKPIANSDTYVKEDVDAIVDLCKKNTNYTIEDACKILNITKIRYTYMYSENTIRKEFRRKIVETIAESGIPITIYGIGWKYLEEKNFPNVTLKEFEFAKDLPNIIVDYRFSLNVLPWFKAGGHDRLFDSYANNLLCFTDTNPFLQKYFTEAVDYRTYSLNEIEKLPKMIDYYLEHTEEAYEIAKSGREEVLDHHLWKHRVELLDSIWRGRKFDYE